jgi:spore maturation protein CgeB
MIAAGWSPSVRLFEAAMCGCPVISDVWEGLDQLFEPGREILLANSTEDVIAALRGIAHDRARTIGEASRQRALREHTSRVRAAELEQYLEQAISGKRADTHAAASLAGE